jgi:hypothetical protein
MLEASGIGSQRSAFSHQPEKRLRPNAESRPLMAADFGAVQKFTVVDSFTFMPGAVVMPVPETRPPATMR